MRLAAIVLALAVLVVPTVMGEDVEGSKDHPLITRYPGSTIGKYSAKEFDEYDLPVAKTKDDGKPERSQHLEGKVTMIVYALPEGRSSLEVYRNYESALTRAHFTPLFACKGDDGPGSCGQLRPYLRGLHGWTSGSYGEQRYLAAKLSRTEGDAYVGLHVDDGYVLLDVIEMKPMATGLVTVDAAALANDIARTGHASVYGIYFDTGKWDVKPESDPALKEIAKVLKQNPALKLHVVGHTDNVGDIAMNLDLSRKRAAAVVQALTTKHGVAATRLRPDGVGPLSPVASNDSEDGRTRNRRVELVKQ